MNFLLRYLLTRYLDKIIAMKITRINKQIIDCCLYLLTTEAEERDGFDD